MSYNPKPLARIALALACGILLRENSSDWIPPPIDTFLPSLLFLLSLGFFAFSLFPLSPGKSFQYRHFFGIGCSLFFLAAGGFSVDRIRAHTPLTAETGADNQLFLLHLQENPTPKTNSYEARAVLTARSDTGSQLQETRLPLLLYLPKDSLSESLHRGMELLGGGRLQRIRNRGNPHEYDYAGAMAHKGIRFSLFLSSYNVTGYQRDTSLRERAAEIRERLLATLHASGLSPDTFGFISAISLGERDNLPQEMREDFSVAGLSHILAVSGLHTGILFLLLMALLSPLKFVYAGRLMYLLCLIFLWGYAFVTGLSASVVRAVCMISFLLLGKIVYRKSDTLNNLFGAAFLMLLFNPAYLHDLGFRMSFASLLSILLFTPVFEKLLQATPPGTRRKKGFGRRIRSRIVELLSVTLSAQILTLPLSIYYFHLFPLWFIPANLIVIPLLTPFLLICFLLICTGLLWGPIPWLTTATEIYASVILKIAALIRSLPGNNLFNALSFSGWEMVLFLALLCSSILFLRNRKAAPLLVLLTTLFLIGVNRQLASPPPASELIVFNQRDGNTLYLREEKNQYLITNDSMPPHERMLRLTEPLTLRNGANAPILLTGDTALHPNLTIRHPLLRFGNKKVMYLTDNRFRYRTTDHRARVELLIVGGSFNGTVASLLPLVEFDKLILGSNLSFRVSEKIKAECDSLGIDLFDLRKEGAFRLEL